MLFKQKKIEINDDEILELSKQIEHSYIFTKILAGRGYDTKQKIDNFLSPKLSDLHDPFLLKDMNAVCDKIKDALKYKKRVLIFGDYDVDGISATAILYKYFESKGMKVDYFLPNRYEDGYGLTIDTAQKVIDLFNPQLVITVDCGISCHKEVDYLMTHGVDVCVTDHHEIPEILPSCPTVDAKQQGQQYPFTDLCGAGVALKIVQALGEDLTPYLPICAIATIADIVSLTDENRAIVTFGLKNLNMLPLGLKQLFSELKISTFNSSDIAFKIAPKINAAGRMGDATISLQLYISNDRQVITDNLKKLTELNQKRQELCNTIYTEAIEQLKQENQNDNRAIILYSKSWDSGLLGIVCARLTEEFNKPTFLFSEVDGFLKGSVRSIPAINIHDVLSSASTLLETFGGHSMAAGLTLKVEHLTKFKYEIENYFLKNYSQRDFVAIKEYDTQIDADKVNIALARELEILEPFGCGNPKPLLYTKYSNLKVSPMKNYAQHLNLVAPNNFALIAFNMGAQKLLIENSYVCEIMYELQVNEFKNHYYIKGLVKNLKCSGYKDNLLNFVQGNYIEQAMLHKQSRKNPFYSYDNLIFLLNKLCAKSSYGTLLVSNDLKKAKELSMFLYTHTFDFYLGEITSHSSNNAIIVGLNSFKNITNYSNIVFLEPLLNMDYLNNFSTTLYLPKNHETKLNFNLDFSHTLFSIFYKNLMGVSSKIVAQSKFEYYEIFKKLCPALKNISYAQFVLCVNTFNELDFIKINNNENFSIEFNRSQEKRELSSSMFYSRLKNLLS